MTTTHYILISIANRSVDDADDERSRARQQNESITLGDQQLASQRRAAGDFRRNVAELGFVKK